MDNSQETKIQWLRIFYRLNSISGYVLFFSALLFFLSGYGQTKGLLNRNLSAVLHDVWLPPVFLIAMNVHLLYPFFRLFKKITRSENLALFYIFAFEGFLVAFFGYWYFR